jgi:hypothetical protein
MSRKNTVYGARHIKEEEEINRIMEYYENDLKLSITKLEASALQAMRSVDAYWSTEKAKKALMRLRGFNDFI